MSARDKTRVTFMSIHMICMYVGTGKRVHNVAVVQYPRSSSMCNRWGIEPQKQLEPKVKRFDLNKDRLLWWRVSILHEK